MSVVKMVKITFMVLIVTAVFSGCMSTKLEMDPGLTSEPKDALLTGLSISLDFGQDGLAGVVSGIIGAASLEQFGENAERNLADFLSAKGFNSFLDADIAKREDIMNTGAALTFVGYWVHPETSAHRPQVFTGPAIGFNKTEFISSIKGNDDVEYFIFADINVYETSVFGIFGGYPLAVFNVAVVDAAGEVVLEARAFGEGKKQFIGSDLSEPNLSAALEDAIIKLNEL